MMQISSRRYLLFACLAWCVLGTLAHSDESALRIAPPETSRQDTAEASHWKHLLPNDSVRKVGSALVMVFGCIAIWTAIQRTYQRRAGSTGPMQSLGAIQVTPKVKLHVVRLGRRLLVLHLTGSRVERIAEISDPDEVELLVGVRPGIATDSPRVEELLRANQVGVTNAYPRGDA